MKGKLGVREKEGMINRVRVSGGGGRDQMEGLALTWREIYSETGEERRREFHLSSLGTQGVPTRWL